MTIPSVVQGTVEFAGKVFQIDSPRGLTWLESVTSFRFEPVGDNKPYTVRKESGKGGDYWYGYRKQNGKLHKKYIGKSSELSTAKLEEIAEALNTPPQPRVTDKVTEVTDTKEEVVTEKVTGRVTIEDFTALRSQVQLLQESLEALRSELPGKSAEGNLEQLPRVTDSELQIELGNLKAENEALRQELAEVKSYYLDMLQRSVHRVEGLLKENETLKTDYATLLESNTAVIQKREQEVREVRSQLAAKDETIAEASEQCDEFEKRWKEEEGKVADRDKIIAELRAELSDLKQKTAPAGKKIPDAAEIYNRYKAKNPKTKFTYKDFVAIVATAQEIFEES